MRRVLSFAALSLLAMSSTASAQRTASHQDNTNPPVELGIDAGLNSELSGTAKTTSFQAPIQAVRAGWFVSPAMSIEPSLTFATATTSGGGGSLTGYGLGLGLLYHLSENRSANQWYVRPFLGFTGYSGTGLTSQSAMNFGGGVGIKMPLANRFATRFEANMDRVMSHNGIPAMNSLNVLFGLSVYSH